MSPRDVRLFVEFKPQYDADVQHIHLETLGL